MTPVCPKAHKYFDITDGKIFKRVLMKCNRFDCPVCGPPKIKREREKYYKMGQGYLLQQASKYPVLYKREGRYWVKMLTLTVPGREYRMAGKRAHYEGHTTEKQAYLDMQSDWNRLNTLLRRYYPRMATIQLYEPQADGYPHFHIVLIGPDANKKGLLEFIKLYWCEKYGMGKFCNLKVMDRGVGGALNYALKYVLKVERGLHQLPKGSRLINAAKRLYAFFEKQLPRFTLVRIGNYDQSSKVYETPFYEVTDERLLLDMESNIENENLKVLLEFFDNVGVHEQLPIKFEGGVF